MELARYGADRGIGKVGHQMAQTPGFHRLAHVGEETISPVATARPRFSAAAFTAAGRSQQGHSFAIELAGDRFRCIGRAIGDHNDTKQIAGIVECQKSLPTSCGSWPPVVDGQYHRHRGYESRIFGYGRAGRAPAHGQKHG